MKEYQSKVGKNLIAMLMFQMYGDSKLIYREYIQNARDAINDAVKAGILNELKDGHISINIDNDKRRITITDNGIGISRGKVIPILLNIADSDKDGENSAGQFGIGRLVGGYYCKRLSFKTSFKGETVASEIVFDIDKIKKILNDDTDHSTATDVIDKSTDIYIIENEEKDNHYFIVTLEDIHPDYPELLNEEIISNYLKEVAPIDYNSAFKNQLIQTSIPENFSQLHKQLGHFKISVNDEVSIKKKYGLKIEGTGDQIINLQYFTLPDDSNGILAWGWYALTEFTKMIPSSDQNSGFRLRKHNIQVGDASLLTDFFPRSEKRGNKYFYGEIHIIDQKIKLNSARDGLAPTPEAEHLKRCIRDFFDHLIKLYHLANNIKKATEKILEINVIRQNPNVDFLEMNRRKDDANKKIKSIENSKNAQSNAAKLMIDSYKQRINESITTPIFEEDLFSENKNLSSPKLLTIQPDAYLILKECFSTDKIELIKRILKSLSDNCPPAHLKLIEELKKKIIKDLAKNGEYITKKESSVIRT